MSTQDFYSHGKLLISGEYLVLHGAVALALPVRFGQKMSVSTSNAYQSVFWNTKMLDNHWFSAEFTLSDLNIVFCNEYNSGMFVQKVLQAAQRLNPQFLTSEDGCYVECNLEFDIRWGLGSSSSLISNVAYWADVDPFELHEMVSKGSGYDVVCARSDQPVFFEIRDGKRLFEPVDFKPPFGENIYFVYLGRKKDSQADVDIFLRKGADFQRETSLISEISKKMIGCSNFEEFGQLMQQHEEIMSGVLGLPNLKSSRFDDLPGEIKSLGAWGGDFAMILWQGNRYELQNYLAKKDLHICYSFNEMI